jgi:hypothetical protein
VNWPPADSGGQADAKLALREVGDELGYPTGNSSTGLAIAGPPDNPEAFVVADVASAGHALLVPQGIPVRRD